MQVYRSTTNKIHPSEMNAQSRLPRRSPSEEYEVESNVNIDWESVTVVDVDEDDPQPSKLAPFCKAFNESKCLSGNTCSDRHICNSCKEPGHSALHCKSLSVKKNCANSGRGLVWDDDENTSFSPCSQSSLTAEPLPMRPPLRHLPPELVKTVKEHPETFKVVTSLNINAFQRLLRRHPNQLFVKSVVKGFREGFWPLADIPYPYTVDESYNSTKNPEFMKFLEEQRDKEILAQRFSSAIGTKLFLGMTCMPVHVVKGSKKLRAIYDHSAGKFAPNSLIRPEARAVKLDGLKNLGYVLRRAYTLAKSKSRGITLFKSDVSSAYRIIPMSPFWQPLQAVKIDGRYYVDRCNTFGNAASQRIFCAFYSLVLWIAENEFDIHDMLTYIDDNFSWDYDDQKRYYSPYKARLPDKQARLLLLWDILGIPHDMKKQESGTILTIIGYEVNVERMRVGVPKTALDEILPMVENLCRRYEAGPVTTTVGNIRRICGKVNWAIGVHPLLRPGVIGLHRLLAGRIDPKEKCTIDEDMQDDLLWLVDHMRNAKGTSFTNSVLWNENEASLTIYASTSDEGMSFWVPSLQQAKYARFASTLTSDYMISLHGIATVACVIEWARRKLKTNRKRLLVYVDDANLIDSFKYLRSPLGANALFRFAMDLLIDSRIDLRVEKANDEKASRINGALATGNTALVTRTFTGLYVKDFSMSDDIVGLLHKCMGG